MTVLTPHRVRKHTDGPFAGQVEHYFPQANEDGFHVLADPAIGSEKHHAKNAILVKEVALALHLVRQHGFSIRKRGNLTKQWNLISAKEVACL